MWFSSKSGKEKRERIGIAVLTHLFYTVNISNTVIFKKFQPALGSTLQKFDIQMFASYG